MDKKHTGFTGMNPPTTPLQSIFPGWAYGFNDGMDGKLCAPSRFGVSPSCLWAADYRQGYEAATTQVGKIPLTPRKVDDELAAAKARIAELEKGLERTVDQAERCLNEACCAVFATPPCSRTNDMPYFRASFRHTFSTGDTVEMTSDPFRANSWDQARELAKAFGYDDDVRIAVADVDQSSGRRTEYPQLTVVE